MYHIFLETSGQIQLTGGDSRYHDHHQEDQDDQECPPSTKDVLDEHYLQYIPMYHIFLETSGQIQLTGGDSRIHDHHQEDLDDQECPPSTKMFLMTLFAIATHVLYMYYI